MCKEDIDYSHDPVMIRLCDEWHGMAGLISELAQARGRLFRKMARHIKKNFGLEGAVWKKYVIDFEEMKLVCKKEAVMNE